MIVGILVALVLIALFVPGGIFLLAIGVLALIVWAAIRDARCDTPV
jgi:hypothetical protein